MPSTRRHLQRARQHLSVAMKWAADTDSLGWASVALFYAARDVAHAVFDADPRLRHECKHPLSHTNPDLSKPGTNEVIKRHYSAVMPSYLSLYGTSTGVRYEGQMVSEDVFRDMLDDWREVCDWAIRQLAAAGRHTLPDWLTNP